MQTITGNSYKNFKYTLNIGTNVITVYDLFDTTLSFDTLALLTLQRLNAGIALYAPSKSLVSSIGYSVPLTCPSAGVPSAGGSITSGLHSYKITNIIGSSETLPSTKSNVVDTTTNKTVIVTLPVGPIGTVSRNLYRTNAGDTDASLYFIATIPDNSTLTYTDTAADNQTTSYPTTSNAYDIFYINASTLSSSDNIVIEVRNIDQTYDYNQNVQKVSVQTPIIPYFNSQSEPIDYLNSSTGLASPNMDVLYLEGYTKHTINITSTTGVANTVYLTLQVPLRSDAVDTSDTNWLDVTTLLTGYSSPIIINPSSNFYDMWLLKDVMFERLKFRSAMVSTGTAAANVLTISIKSSN